MRIRPEDGRDQAAVRRLHEAAFGGTVEADIVERLHREGSVSLALVAELEGEVVGHVVFSPVTIDAAETRLVGLGPVAVAPDHQRRGIGGRLIEAGLARLRDAFDAVVVVGHPEYYPRFGFVPADTFGLRCEYDVPREVFMALELQRDALRGVSGLVRYHPAFAEG